MRKLIYSLIVATVFTFAASFANAQQKIAHINSQELMAQLPEAKTAQTELESLQKKKQEEMQVMYTERENKVKAAQEKYKAITDAKQDPEKDTQLQSMSTDINQLDERIQQAQQGAQKEIQEKQQALLTPIQQKVIKAINDVAKAKGLSYVLDVANVIYADGGIDITADVKAKLGVK